MVSDTIDRLDDESPEAYSAFCDYVNLGPDRSLAKVAAIGHSNRPDIDRGTIKSRMRQLERWSSRHDWQARTRQADSEAAAEVRQAMVATQVTMAKLAGEKLLAALALVEPETLATKLGYLPRWIESVGSLSRLLAGQATSVVETHSVDEAAESRRQYDAVMADLQARAQRVATQALLPDE